MSMKNMSKADLHKLLYSGGHYRGFQHHQNCILLAHCYTRTVLATALSLLVHSYKAGKRHHYKVRYMNYMVHCYQTLSVKLKSKPTAVSDVQCELATQLLYVIHDDNNVDIELTEMSNLILAVAVMMLREAMKPVPRDDIHILVEATLDGLIDIEMNVFKASPDAIDKIKL